MLNKLKTRCTLRPHFIGKVKLQCRPLWRFVTRLCLTVVIANVTPGQLLSGKLEPDCTQNQAFHLLASDWPFLSLNQTFPSQTHTIHPTLFEDKETFSDSSLSYIRLIFSTVHLCLSSSVIYSSIVTRPIIIAL